MYAFDYAEKHLIETEKDYPYKARNGKCQADDSKGVVKVNSYKRVKADDADAMKEALSLGPCTVSV